jgi:uncharacterized tellurite resistance protein B-like protein
MDAKQHLFYGIGNIAYALAGVDGKVQREEKEALQKLIATEINKIDSDADYTDIIFQVLDKDKANFEKSYKQGINAIKLGEHKLTPILKWQFVALLQKVAEAYPPATDDENEVIARFIRDLRAIGH